MSAVYICYAEDENFFAADFAKLVQEFGLEVLTSDTPDRKTRESDVDRSAIFFLVLSQGWRDSMALDALVHYAFAQSKKIVILKRQAVDVPAMLRSAPIVDVIGANAISILGVLGEYLRDVVGVEDMSPTIFGLSNEEQAAEVETKEPEEPAPKPQAMPSDEQVLDDLLDIPDADEESTELIRPPFATPPMQEALPPPSNAPAPQPADMDRRRVSGIFGTRDRAEYSRSASTPATRTFIDYGLSPADMAQQLTNPQFSAFYPAQVEAAKPYALMVFAHIEAAIADVREEAGRFSSVMGGQPTSATATSKVEIAQGTLLTFVPQITGISLTPSQQVIQWDTQQPYYSATFLFQTPPKVSGTIDGRVLVFKDALIVGEIPVKMQVVGQVNSGFKTEAPFKKLEPIFASYSHRDTPVMEYFRKSRAALGQKMLVDIYDLRAGEHWADRLLEWIDDSAIFQLFWSRNSAASQYCRKEWEYALKYVDNRERFIQPVWWENEMPSPPPELADLHFQKITLPPVTRFKMLTSRLRGMFGGN